MINKITLPPSVSSSSISSDPAVKEADVTKEKSPIEPYPASDKIDIRNSFHHKKKKDISAKKNLKDGSKEPEAKNSDDKTKKEIIEKGKTTLEAVNTKQNPPLYINAEDSPLPLAHIINSSGKDSSKSDGENAGGIEVTSFEKKLQKQLGPQASIQNSWDIENLEGRIPPLSELQQIFDKIAANPALPYEYLPDGCYARAHEASESFVKQGINTAKLYVLLDGVDWESFSPLPEGRFLSENKYTQGEWWYHVAPLTFAKDDVTGEIDGYVIDPSINGQRPLKADEWVKSFWKGDFPIKFDTTHADVYDPPMESLTGTLPAKFSLETFEENLHLARVSNYETAKVLAEIKQDYHQRHLNETETKG